MPLLQQLGLLHFFIQFPFTGEEGERDRQGKETPSGFPVNALLGRLPS